MRKYEFTKETLNFNNRTLHQIVATRDFGNVKKGDLGGWIETEGNLLHDGFCWVSGDAQVYGNAKVFDNALVSGDAWVYDNALVCGNARVSEYARVFGNAWVSGNALVSGKAWVCGNALVSGNARVYGKVEIKSATHLTEGNHDGESVKEIQVDLTEENNKLRQENEELKAKLTQISNISKF
jgi:carbonic anhydrase/acetyltransferase-like protein (isoleucine patch superfamily)